MALFSRWKQDRETTLERLRADNSALRDALRKVAIVKTYKADGTFVRNDCEICVATCGPDQMLTHVGDCPLIVLNPSF